MNKLRIYNDIYLDVPDLYYIPIKEEIDQVIVLSTLLNKKFYIKKGQYRLPGYSYIELNYPNYLYLFIAIQFIPSYSINKVEFTIDVAEENIKYNGPTENDFKNIFIYDEQLENPYQTILKSLIYIKHSL